MQSNRVREVVVQCSTMCGLLQSVPEPSLLHVSRLVALARVSAEVGQALRAARRVKNFCP